MHEARPVTLGARPQGSGTNNAPFRLFRMQRRSNWKPVIVPTGHGAAKGNVDEGETIFHAAQSGDAKTSNTDRVADVRFTIAAALGLGLPALLGAGLYLAAIAVLRSS
jgi:hypothetical protein